MGISIYDVLEKKFVGAGIADGNDLFNIVTNVDWNEDTRIFVVQSRNANGDQAELRIDLNVASTGAGGGLSESDVRYTIGQVVDAWAIQANQDVIPSNKLPVATPSAQGAVTLASEAEALAGTDNSKVNTPFTLKHVLDSKTASETALGFVQKATGAEITAGTDDAKYMSVKQIKDLVAGIRTGGGGLNAAGVDQRILIWARAGNTDTVPLNKLSDASETAKGIARLATNSEVDAGTNNATIVTPAGVKRYVDANASGGSGAISTEAGSILAFSSRPSNLSPYPLNTVIRNISPPAWWILSHDGTSQTGTVQYSGGLQVSGEYGVSLLSGGSGFNANAVGQIRDFEGDSLTPSTSPIGSIAIEAVGQAPISTTVGDLKIYIKDSAVQSEWDVQLFARTYAGVPTNNNILGTARLNKGESVTLNGEVWRVYRTSTGDFGTSKLDPAGYIRFFTFLPEADDQITNQFHLFNEGLKFVEIGSAYTPTKPTADADFAHDVDFVVFETDEPDAHTYNFTYQGDLDNRFFEATPTVIGHVTADLRYHQVGHGDSEYRGRWSLVFPTSVTANPFPKTVSHIQFKVGSNASVEVPVSRDTAFATAYALKSTNALTSDPTGLTGTSHTTPVSIRINYKFTDNTYQYSDVPRVTREKVNKSSLAQFVKANQDVTQLDTGAQIKAKLEALEAGSRLNADFVDNVEGNIKTPQRVNGIPSDPQNGTEVYQSQNNASHGYYRVYMTGVIGTELANAGVGNYCWWRRPDEDFTHGVAEPDLDPNFVLISNNRVYVKRGTLTDLTHVEDGRRRRYTLTRVAQAAGTKILSDPALAASQPDVDYYTIGGSLGLSRNLRFLKRDGTWIPSTTLLGRHKYYSTARAFFKDGFGAAPADVTKSNLFVSCGEVLGGFFGTSGYTFVADGTDFSVNDPVEGIKKITYHNTASDSAKYHRYSVQIYLAGFTDKDTPTKLTIGTHNYVLSYFETSSADGGTATYLSGVVVQADRISSTALTKNYAIIKKDGGQYQNVSDPTFVSRSLSVAALRKLASGIDAVHQLPSHPLEGQAVRTLNAITIPDFTVMKAAETVTSGGATFVGWTRGGTGSLDKDAPSIDGVGAYFRGRGTLNNVVAVQLKSGLGKDLTHMTVNDTRYDMTAVGGTYTHYRRIAAAAQTSAGGTRHFFVPGQLYRLQFEFDDGSKEFADVTFDADTVLRYIQMRWQREFAEVSDWALKENTETIPLAKVPKLSREKLPIVEITQAAYDALAVKDPNTYYLIT